MRSVRKAIVLKLSQPLNHNFFCFYFVVGCTHVFDFSIRESVFSFVFCFLFSVCVCFFCDYLCENAEALSFLTRFVTTSFFVFTKSCYTFQVKQKVTPTEVSPCCCLFFPWASCHRVVCLCFLVVVVFSWAVWIHAPGPSGTGFFYVCWKTGLPQIFGSADVVVVVYMSVFI